VREVFDEYVPRLGARFVSVLVPRPDGRAGVVWVNCAIISDSKLRVRFYCLPIQRWAGSTSADAG
jgi:hypothetical protein